MEESLAGVNQKLATTNQRVERVENEGSLTNEFLDLTVEVFEQKFNSLMELIQGDSLEQLEQRRETAKQQQTLMGMLEGVNENLEKGVDQRDKIIEGQEKEETSLAALGILGGTIAIALGGLVGVFKGYVESFKALLATVRTIGSIIGRGVKAIRDTLSLGTLALRIRFESINKIFMSFEKVGSRIVQTFTRFANQVGKILKVTGALGRATLMAPINTFFAAIRRINGTFSSAATRVSKLGASFAKAFSAAIGIFRSAIQLVVQPIRAAAASTGKIGQLLGKIGGFFRNLLGSVGKVAGVVSKIFAPLNFIFVAFKTIQGAIQGFKEGGILGGLQGAISGFFKALVGVPLDFIKGAVSWILGLFGLDKVAAFLDSFSFSDLIGSIVAAPFKALEAIRDFISDKIKGFVGSLVGFLPNWLKKSLGIGDSDESSEPVEATSTDEFSGAGAGAAGTPMANEPTRVGRANAPGESTASSQELEMAQREQGALESRGRGRGGSGNVGVSNVNNSTTNMFSQPTINNNPLPSPSRQPDTAKDLFFRNSFASQFQ